MGAEIGLLSSMTQIQNLSQSQHKPQPLPNPSSFFSSSSSFSFSSFWIMWNPRDPQEDDDSWEVRAFAQDTTSLMGTTWPPRSYTCTFCRREFRSAQALGGHMNIHRRDRARLHHHPPPTPPPPPPPSNLIANNGGGGGGGGLCLLYHLPSGTSTTSAAATLNACGESISKSVSSPSRLLSIMPYPPNNFDFRVERHELMNSSSYCDSSSKVENPTTSGSYAHNGHKEELDLELRLGNRPTPT